MNIRNQQSGFTLIELVVVIVILGILAATAVPKFIDLQSDAYESTLEGVKASMLSAGSMVYSKSIVKGNQSQPFPSTVDIGGESVVLSYGYPIAEEDEWEKVLDLDTSNDFDYGKSSPTSINAPLTIFPLGLYKTFSDIPADFACTLSYSHPLSPDTLPVITIEPCE